MNSRNLGNSGELPWIGVFCFILSLCLSFFNASMVSAAGIFSTDYFEQNVWSKNDIKKNHVSKILQWLKERNPKIRRQALGECKYTLDRLVNHPQALMLCSFAEQELNRKGWLIPYFERAIRLHPKYGITWAQYGLYLANVLGKPKTGISKLEKAILVDPKLKPAYGWLAKIYYSIGQEEKAKEVRARALSHGIRLGDPSRP